MSLTLKTNIGILIGAFLTPLTYFVGLHFGWVSTDSINWWEVAAVFTSYTCTYLCVVQSRSNYIWGVITTLLWTVVFFDAKLYSSMALNAYLAPTLAWGWYRWGRDDNTRPVQFVEMKWWPVYLILTAAVWYVMSQVAIYFGGPLARLDSIILAGSILAQFLLDQKKIETWAVWAIVNVTAIYVYLSAEPALFLTAFQFVFFLLNTIYGAVMWSRSMRKV